MQTYTGKAESKEGHDKVSEERSKRESKKSTNDGSKAPVTQDAKVNDVPSCAKCGQVFNPPWTQRHHRCPGSAEPSTIVDKPVPAARIHKAVQCLKGHNVLEHPRSAKWRTQMKLLGMIYLNVKNVGGYFHRTNFICAGSTSVSCQR